MNPLLRQFREQPIVGRFLGSGRAARRRPFGATIERARQNAGAAQKPSPMALSFSTPRRIEQAEAGGAGSG